MIEPQFAVGKERWEKRFHECRGEYFGLGCDVNPPHLFFRHNARVTPVALRVGLLDQMESSRSAVESSWFGERIIYSFSRIIDRVRLP